LKSSSKDPVQPTHSDSSLSAAEKHTFLQEIQPGLFPEVFAALHGVLFFLKDRSGRFVVIAHGPPAEKAAFKTPRSCSPEAACDHSLYPKAIADRIRADDLSVMESRSPLLNVVEFLVNPRRCAIGWHITNKFPVFDACNRVIGVMGTVQPCDDRFRRLLEGTRLDQVVESICSNPAAEHRVADLARLAGMSTRQMGRHFLRVLGVSPRDFMMLCRLKIACGQLAFSSGTVADISQMCGFCDQSSFAYQFRRTLGMAPLEYRRLYS
jgi:AraC-like DNA-binding protein